MGSVRIIGFGEAPPEPDEMIDNEQVLARLRSNGINTKGKTGQDIEDLVGIKTRWHSPLSSVELALIAAQNACQDASFETGGQFNPEKIQLIHSGGSSPDNLYPACACILQNRLGVPTGDCEARDISLACTSLVDGLALADSRMRHKGLHYGLVAGGESIGVTANPPLSFNHTLWGTGGGAVVLEHDPAGDDNYGIIASKNISDGQYSNWTRSIGIGTLADHRTFEFLDPSMEGHERDIQRYGIKVVSQLVKDFLDELGDDLIGINDLSRLYLLPHNANLRMDQEMGSRVYGLPIERILTRIPDRGNPSSVSVFITLAYYAAQEQFHRDDLILMVGFGSGMSVCIVLYRWP